MENRLTEYTQSYRQIIEKQLVFEDLYLVKKDNLINTQFRIFQELQGSVAILKIVFFDQTFAVIHIDILKEIVYTKNKEEKFNKKIVSEIIDKFLERQVYFEIEDQETADKLQNDENYLLRFLKYGAN